MTGRLSEHDRIKRIQLGAKAIEAARAIRHHRTICADCHPDDNWPSRVCGKGWDLAKKAHAALNEQRDFERSLLPPEPDTQATLW